MTETAVGVDGTPWYVVVGGVVCVGCVVCSPCLCIAGYLRHVCTGCCGLFKAAVVICTRAVRWCVARCRASAAVPQNNQLEQEQAYKHHDFLPASFHVSDGAMAALLELRPAGAGLFCACWHLWHSGGR